MPSGLAIYFVPFISALSFFYFFVTAVCDATQVYVGGISC